MQVKVIVAAHKPYDVLCDAVYLPVHAGAARTGTPLYQSDAQGEHISGRNDLYCELTALYWAWKNLPADALGLVHYRRYLGVPARMRPWIAPLARAASGEELARYLKDVPVLLPKKRNYFIENREDQFVHAHGRAAIDALRRVMGQSAPAYLPAFDRTMKRTSGHCFNMFVMRRDVCDAYCAWMFDLLFKTEALLREEAPQEIRPRLLGFLSERMLDCWLETNDYRWMELPVVHTESVNWPAKAAAFLKRKFARKSPADSQ